jgi:hypothetical protein
MEDTDILVNMAKLILSENDAIDNLMASVENSARPEAGTAMFVMMMIQSINDMLEQAGIEIDPSSWLAPDGVLDQLMPMIEQILEANSVPVGPDFAEGVTDAVLERAKGAMQAEQGGAPAPTEQAAPSPAGGLLGAMGGGA